MLTACADKLVPEPNKVCQTTLIVDCILALPKRSQLASLFRDLHVSMLRHAADHEYLTRLAGAPSQNELAYICLFKI